MSSDYQKLLGMILDPDLPDPTIVVYNERHMNTLRAGLSRAKRKASTLREFQGESTLDALKFKYTPDSDKPHLITISLVPDNNNFSIVFADDAGKPRDSDEQVLDNMAGLKASTED